MKSLNFAKILALIFVFGCAIQMQAQTLELVKSIDVKEEIQGISPVSTDIFGASRKKIGKYACINLEPLINKTIQSIPREDYAKFIIIIRGEGNNYVSATIGDFISKNSGISPRLCLDVTNLHLGDTVRIYDKGVKTGGIDTELMDQEVTKYTKSTLYINLMASEYDNARAILPNFTLFFAVDQTTLRWIKKVTKIEFYKIKS